MLLKELFSPIGSPKEDDQDIDWLDDLKFFIDNDDGLLQKYMFPAVKKHEQYRGNPNVYKIYLRVLRPCLDAYCDQFDIDDRDEKFSDDKLEQLAKRIAGEQERHIENGDYHRDET